MKVYFSGSVGSKSLYEKNYKAIVAALQKMGHEVIYQYLFKVDENIVNQQTLEDRIQIHKQLDRWKLDCDVVIAELSNRSFGQGQEIAFAFRVGKPVIGLYTKGNKPHLIISDAGDRLLLLEYSLENLPVILNDAIDFVIPDDFKRFTLLLPAHLISYLDKTRRDKNISRSEYIRSLIEKDMRKP